MRRPKGTGSIWKTPKGWVAQLELGVVDGRRVRRRFHGPTKAAVSKRLEDQRRLLSEGVRAPESLTVGTFLGQWLRDIDVRPKTWQGYESIVRTGLTPDLGTIRLGALTVADVERYVAGRKDVSPMTRRHHLAALRAALKHAIRRGYLTRNVAALARMPKLDRRQVVAMSAEEVRRLLETTKDDRLHALYRLAVSTGLRQGEVLGLRWSDVNLEERTLTVQWAWQAGKWVAPKSDRSRRSVPLLPELVTALREHRRRQNAERLGNVQWADNDLVFANQYGEGLYGPDVTRRFQAALAAAGLPRYTFHQLRHTAASFLIQQGADLRMVMEILGHSTITLTANTYSHLTDAGKRAAVDRLSELLG